MKRLLINADDFNLTPGVSAGIVAGLDTGGVTSTTVMVCGEQGVSSLERWRARIAGRAGLHLQLTGGRPCLPPEEVPTLVGPEGAFLPGSHLPAYVAPDEVDREWRAQVRRLQAAGIQPTHLDSHHHVHFRPALWPVFVGLARDLRLAARPAPGRAADLRSRGVPCADRLETRWYGVPSIAALLPLLDEAFDGLGEDGTVELMCHPGWGDAPLAGLSRYVQERGAELAVLRSAELAEALRARNIVRVGVAAL